MATTDSSLDSLRARKRWIRPGISTKVAAIMTLCGGVLGGVIGGWEGVPVVAVFCGIIGGIVGWVLKSRITLWSGLGITLFKAILGGCFVGMLLGLATGLVVDGLSRVSVHSMAAVEAIAMVVSVIPIAAMAGFITGAVLWWDSGRQDD